MRLPRYSRATLLLLGLVLSACTATRPARFEGTDTMFVPIGRLGAPMGNLLLIEGVHPLGHLVNYNAVVVDKVNGRPLPQPVEVDVQRVNALVKGQRYAFRGYETIGFGPIPPAIAQFAKLKHQPDPGEAQQIWHAYSIFTPLEVVEPSTLHLLDTDRGS